MEKDALSSVFHYFSEPVASIALPEKFTCPFHYTPHPLCQIAAKEVQTYIQQQPQWQAELEKGKMFGVLIVRNQRGEIGYLSAFSGLLANQNTHPFFVPPIYDVLQPEGFFQQEEKNISALNTRIKNLTTDTLYLQLCQTLHYEEKEQEKKLSALRLSLQQAKENREKRRKNTPDATELDAMIRESQFQKAEYKRLKQKWENQIAQTKNRLEAFQQKIDNLKTERRCRSALLQQRLFEHFKIKNARGESKTLYEIFKETTQRLPPAGAGECAAPKLLYYAYQHHLIPIAMAEFWWGASPVTELRRHGYYYPACKSKCEPILKFMLQGLEVEDNPLETFSGEKKKLEIVYEDSYIIVINKPAGILSVPGKSNSFSIWQQIREDYPEATGPLLVHRLDMATSGLLLIAKTKEIHKVLQLQFCRRCIQKRYLALLDGRLSSKEGIVELPLCLNPDDRPRQSVNFEFGKPAITRYKVLEQRLDTTLVTFFPITGRTHQLRVHAAHPLGLNAPILGDELYGRKSHRLYLHASYLEFKHPISGQIIQIEKGIKW